jgi:hypothetical protein
MIEQSNMLSASFCNRLQWASGSCSVQVLCQPRGAQDRAGASLQLYKAPEPVLAFRAKTAAPKECGSVLACFSHLPEAPWKRLSGNM